MKLSHAVVVALLLSFSTPGFAQQPQPTTKQTAPTKEKQQSKNANQKNKDEVVRISTTLVQVDVAVTDRKGRPVNDLKPEEFEIYEDGRRQQITNFSYIFSGSTEAPGAPSTGTATPKDKNPLPPPPPRLRPNQVRRTIALV